MIFLDDHKQIKYNTINKIFVNVESITIYNMPSIDFSSLLSEIIEMKNSILREIDIAMDICSVEINIYAFIQRI